MGQGRSDLSCELDFNQLCPLRRWPLHKRSLPSLALDAAPTSYIRDLSATPESPIEILRCVI